MLDYMDRWIYITQGKLLCDSALLVLCGIGIGAVIMLIICKFGERKMMTVQESKRMSDMEAEWKAGQIYARMLEMTKK